MLKAALLFVAALSIDSAAEEICETKMCILDANRLINAADNDAQVKPCDDFKEFAVGNFLRYRALHDRYDRIGFLYDTLAVHNGRQRKMLLEPITADESFVSKIAKNFFQKCIDPDYIRNQGKLETEEYLKNKGLPLVEGAAWRPEWLNLTFLLEEPAFLFDYFVMHKVTRCPHPEHPDQEILCWQFSYTMDFLHKYIASNPEKTRLDFIDMINEVNFKEKIDLVTANESVNNMLLFFEKLMSIEQPIGRQKIPAICKIKEIGTYLTPNSRYKLDWLYFVNDAFMNDSQVKSDEEEILIEDWKLFAGAIELLENLPPRVVGDVILLGFLYAYRHMYTMYPFNRIDEYKRGTKKDLQRFEQCIDIVEVYYGVGLLSMYGANFVDPTTLPAVEGFVREAVADVIQEFSKADDLDEAVKADVVSKLNQTLIVLGGMPQIYDRSKMEELYGGIGLSGNEKLLETTIKLVRYHNKIDNEPKSSWKYQINGLSHRSNLKYLTENNVINIPYEYIDFPYFHPNRSRFFNTATLFTEVVLSLNEGIKEYIKKTHGISYTFNYDSVQLGYKNYMRWLDTHTDKTLPGFSLANNQMYWLTFANTYFMKYHSNVPFFQLESLKLQLEYFHLWFKFRPEFREAFNCSEPTAAENEQFETFIKKFNAVFRN